MYVVCHTINEPLFLIFYDCVLPQVEQKMTISAQPYSTWKTKNKYKKHSINKTWRTT